MVSNHPLKVYREARGITQEALAEELGVAGVSVSRWETGARKIGDALLTLISERTGIPAKELRPDLAKVFEVSQ